MADRNIDASASRNPDARPRRTYSPPKIIFSELAHGSTEGPTPIPHKIHGSDPSEMHSDSTIGTS
jgi:hypothetical protein